MFYKYDIHILSYKINIYIQNYYRKISEQKQERIQNYLVLSIFLKNFASIKIKHVEYKNDNHNVMSSGMLKPEAKYVCRRIDIIT